MPEPSFRVEVECAPPGHAAHRHVLEVASTGYVPGAADLREVALLYVCPVSGDRFNAVFTPEHGHQRPFRVVGVS
jgi:hypothetical protein